MPGGMGNTHVTVTEKGIPFSVESRPGLIEENQLRGAFHGGERPEIFHQEVVLC